MPMNKAFNKIGICIKHEFDKLDLKSLDCLKEIIDILQKNGNSLVLETSCSELLPEFELPSCPLSNIGEQSDLVIVIGGDGSLLKIARAIVKQNIPILGINRGRLGFLADLNPKELQVSLLKILAGSYSVEERSLLTGKVVREGVDFETSTALNDIVLYTSGFARMIEFEVAIDGQFVFKQRADGLIVSTPTGSTAYALSGGGPILYPSMAAILLLPMFPHTLTSRPIVIPDSSTIELTISSFRQSIPKLSIDGQKNVILMAGDVIKINRSTHQCHLVHPSDYNYFSVLRQKLGWSTDFGSNRWSNSKD